MQSLFQQIKAGQLWDFHGGIHPPTRKSQTNCKPLGRLSLPERLYVPLRQHIGVPGSLLVQPGQSVQKGQPLTFADNAMAVPVHAPTSGTILAIEPHIAPHPSALPELCVVIVPDGLDQWRPREPLDLLQADRQQILQRIHSSGIAGMGGAGFPTHLKSGAQSGVDYLIVNAVECEPYISADDVLMQEFATTIVKGIDILCELLKPAAVLIGIEDDKPQAIQAMRDACSQRDHYLVKVVPAKYPSGGEKQLIQLLTSKEVPAGRRPLDIGIVMQNVGTVFAIAQAVLEDIPLIQRIVTVTGDTLSQPQNMLALIGTPVGFLLDACGFSPEPAQRVIMGGPMMGFTLPSISVPLVKTTNCILAPSQAELPAAGAEMDCIRCGACAEVCPATLLPQQLFWYSKAQDQQKLQEYNLADCIECGACAYVCPSEIPLVHYYRVAKAEIRESTREAFKAEQAKARFEARNQRLELEKQQRAARNQQLAAQRQQMMTEQQKNRDVAMAQARLAPAADTELSKADIIAERERKKAEARAYQAEKARQLAQQPADLPAESEVIALTTAAGSGPSDHQPAATSPAPAADAAPDARSSAVAAAIARAKAKKAQLSAANVASPASGAADSDGVSQPAPALNEPIAADPLLSQAVPTEPAPVATAADPRAAAVAAAIARAKAKKAQQQLDQDSSEVQAQPQPTTATGHHMTHQTADDTGPETGPETAQVTEDQAPLLPPAIDTSAAAAVPDREAAKRQALAAAIARAKTRQQAATAAEQLVASGNGATPDQVVAPVQAEADQQETNQTETNQTEPMSGLDPKKAAIAAAIARAKAKQQAQLAQTPHQPDAEEQA